MEEYLKNLFHKMEKKKQEVSDNEDFEKMVKSFNMTCKRSLSESKGRDYVIETWFNKEFPLFAITRIFDTESELFDSIPKDQKIKLLNSLLEKEVEVENYEKAATLRDKIIEIK